MFEVDFLSRTPVFEQIVEKTEEYVRVGILNAGDKMPSVRELTSQIGVNPNTIQKAYNELERRGITVSVAGRGSFISKDVSDTIKSSAMSRLPELEKLVKELKSAGIDGKTIIETVTKAIE